MRFQQERRRRLNRQIQEFESRRSIFRQFIVDNVNKINRQYQTFQTMRSEQAQGRETMNELITASREMRQRCAKLQQQIKSLQPVEKFLLEALTFLPEGYIVKSQDPLLSLMLRYHSLTQTRKHLLQKWEENQNRFEEDLIQTNHAARKQKQFLIEKIAKIQDMVTEAEELRGQSQYLDKAVDREKANLNMQASWV
uniref:DUF4200 domain-containing protein n=1 Tax=Mesocestoides corti TaxID=53468 RepID=A0A5K3ES63_MESCO